MICASESGRSLQALLAERDQRRDFEERWKLGRLKFRQYRAPSPSCRLCGATARTKPVVIEYYDSIAKEKKKMTVISRPIFELMHIPERAMLVCRDCFVERLVGRTSKAPYLGNCHPAVPWSERNYDGGRFYAGEF